MELFLQFGHGMMKMSRELIQKWGGGVVIFSPRDLKYKQMSKFHSELQAYNGDIVIDPQFYMPRANHERLIAHDFWPQDYQTVLFDVNEIQRMLRVLKDDYNDPFESLFFILPGHYTSVINKDWYDFNSIIVNEAIRMRVHDQIYITLCFSNELLQSEEELHLALEYIESWDVDGVYIVPEPPNGQYLVENPLWIINLMDFVAGLKIQGKRVVVGYSSHQMLNLALSKVDAIASGKWLNVRSFNVEKFKKSEKAEGRRSTWYYCPTALSEYQIPFLDIAQRMGMLDNLKTPLDFNSDYSDILFSGAQPSTVNFSETAAFNHYLQCLKAQVDKSVKVSYIATKENLELQLKTSRMLTESLNENGITGRKRDFSEVVDINLSAITAFDRIRGMIQTHIWDDI